MMIAAFIFLLFAINVNAFLRINKFNVNNRYSSSISELNMKWDSTSKRPPLPVPNFLDQSMDAAWGRGKMRTEVWEDDVNPMDNWWEIYSPSEEEMDAVAGGFDFSNVEDWCKEKGIDYDEYMESYKEEADKLVEEYRKEYEAALSSASMASLAEEQEKFFKLQRQAFMVAFRQRDNMLQKEKGQPSLDVEDTGKQYKNDPIDK